MGKQVVFFATPTDLELLFQKISLKGGVVLDHCGTKISDACMLSMCADCFTGSSFGCDFYLTLDGLNVSFSSKKERRIDPFLSEVISFHPCARQPKIILDTSPVDAHFKIGDYIVVDDTEKYNQLMNDYMKHPRYKNNPNYVENGFEHARFWFEPVSIDKSGNKTAKSKQLSSLFAFLKNHINRNYKLSDNGFGYIGADAYARYCLGNFIPCSGNAKVYFDKDTPGTRGGLREPF